MTIRKIFSGFEEERKQGHKHIELDPIYYTLFYSVEFRHKN